MQLLVHLCQGWSFWVSEDLLDIQLIYVGDVCYMRLVMLCCRGVDLHLCLQGRKNWVAQREPKIGNCWAPQPDLLLCCCWSESGWFTLRLRNTPVFSFPMITTVIEYMLEKICLAEGKAVWSRSDYIARLNITSGRRNNDISSDDVSIQCQEVGHWYKLWDNENILRGESKIDGGWRNTMKSRNDRTKLREQSNTISDDKHSGSRAPDSDHAASAELSTKTNAIIQHYK